MKSRSTLQSTIAAGLTAIFMATGTTAASAEPPTDRSVVVDLDNLGALVDSEGDPLTVESDVTQGAERTIKGTQATGTPFAITVYLGPPTDDAPGFEQFVENAQLIGGDVTTPPPPDDTPQPADTTDYVPIFATAVTPTTVSLSWLNGKAGETVELTFNENPATLGAEPHFVATGLIADAPFQMSLTVTEGVTTPSSETPPGLAASTECPAPANVPFADLAGWDLTQTRDAASIVIDNAVRVLTFPGSPAPRAVAMHPLGLPLTPGLGIEIEWDGTSPAPSARLEVDIDEDGIADGVLVSSSAQASVWAADPLSSPAVLSAAPTPASSSGLLDDWSAALPSATLLRFGYELGANGPGDGAISSITIGCTLYSFGDSTFVAAPAHAKVTTSTFSVSTLAKPIFSRNSASNTPAVDLVNSTDVQYRTFLPFYDLTETSDLDNTIVTACIAMHMVGEVAAGRRTYLPNEATFVGDGRGFEPPEDVVEDDSFRTMMNVGFDWDSGRFNNFKDVKDTVIIHNDTGEELDRRTATMDWMLFKNPRQSATYAAVDVSHIANDPFCWSMYQFGAISYDARVEMYRSGLVRVSGWRFTMPSHEVWVRWNEEPQWTNMFDGVATSLGCLVAGWPTRTVGLPELCYDDFTGDLTRTTDKWLSFDGAWGSTASGAIWGSGDTSVLAPQGGDQPGCFVHERVVKAPSLPSGVTAIQIEVSSPFNHATYEYDHWVTVLGSNGSIYTWGNATDAQLGRSATPENRHLPTAIDVRSYRSFSNAGSTTYAVTTGGDVYAWGEIIYDTNTIYFPPSPLTTPTLQYSGEDIVQVEVARNAALALDEDGAIHQVGLDVYDPVTESDFQNWRQRSTPGLTFIDIAVVSGFRTGHHALYSQGRLYYWNGSNLITLGNSSGHVPSPELVDTSFLFQEIEGSDRGTGLSDDGTTVANWHDFREGGTLLDPHAQSVPAPPATVTALTRHASGTPFGVGVDDRGAAWVLGYSDTYELEWQFYGRPPSRDERLAAVCA